MSEEQETESERPDYMDSVLDSVAHCPLCEDETPHQHTEPARRELPHSAAVPRINLAGLHERLLILEQGFDDMTELMSEWEEHVATWRFTPENLTADMICVALQSELYAYTQAHSLPELWPGSQFQISDEWAAEFWTWLTAQPMAARMLRSAKIDTTCFLEGTDAPKAFELNVRDACLEFIRQRYHLRYVERGQ